MIVDLLRNDLGRLCEIAASPWSASWRWSPTPTVHHLVSTISGQLKPSSSVLECVRRCFPGGSMTGAPKLRTIGDQSTGWKPRPAASTSGALRLYFWPVRWPPT